MRIAITIIILLLAGCYDEAPAAVHMQAPELDTNSLGAGLTLLGGALAVLCARHRE